jgi:hypothetical protein
MLLNFFPQPSAAFHCLGVGQLLLYGHWALALGSYLKSAVVSRVLRKLFSLLVVRS